METNELTQSHKTKAQMRICAGSEFTNMRETLLAISTDIAQDALEDPVGFAEREKAGFFRIGKGVRDKLNALLSQPAAKVGTFDVLKVMTDRNMDIRLSTLDNVTNLELKKGNTFIRIGFSGNVMGIAKGEFVGGLLLARKEQWDAIRKELKEAPNGE